MTYSLVMMVFVSFILPVPAAIVFGYITFVVHTATDFVTSKIVAKKFKENHLGSSIPNLGAFTWILFDQFLHAAQLILTYNLFIKN